MTDLFAEYRTRPAEEPRPPLPADLAIRPAEPADLEFLAVIAHGRSGGELKDHRARFERDLAEDRDPPERNLLVADTRDGIAGFARALLFRPGPDAPANSAPAGWYLMGVVVRPSFRRHGLGAELTRRRLEWIADRAPEAWYFVNALNRVSIELHAGFGFREVTRDFAMPGASFVGGAGILFRVDLGAAQRAAPRP